MEAEAPANELLDFRSTEEIKRRQSRRRAVSAIWRLG